MLVNKNEQSTEAQIVLADWNKDPIVGYMNPWYDKNGNVVSIGQYKINGAYLRTELRPKYYRNKQLNINRNNVETSSYTSNLTYQPDPDNWNLFLKMLDLMAEKKLHVIVNILEEAPYTYNSNQDLQAKRDFMNGFVADEVRKRGFDYVSIDFNKLKDSDYFDYNHLNSVGVEKYTKLFTKKVKDLIEPANAF